MIGAIVGGIVGATAAANSTLYAYRGLFSHEDPEQLPKSDYDDIDDTSGFRFLGLRVISHRWGPQFSRLAERISFHINEINLRIGATGRKACISACGLQIPAYGNEYIRHIALRPPYLHDSYNYTITFTFDLLEDDTAAPRKTATRLHTVSMHDLAGFRWPNTESHPWAESDSEEVRCINEWKDMQKTVLLERSLDWLERFIRDKGPCGLHNLLSHMHATAIWHKPWRDEFAAGCGVANGLKTAGKAQTEEP